MYRPRAFAIDDVAVLRAFLRARSFGTLAVTVGGEIHFAYAPVVLAGDVLRFHLARGNPAASVVEGAKAVLSFLGDDAYVSPDWYESGGLVPTWNYLAVEARGTLRRLDEAGLRRLLVDLSAEQEARLPKQPWLIDKVPDARLEMMLRAIVGFELALESLEGKFKLSQDKSEADIAGVIAALEARGDARSLAVARAMRAGGEPYTRFTK